MQEDLNQLYEELIKTHPNPYLYCSQEKLDSALLKAQTAVTSPKTLLEFSLVISSFIKTIRDSHTFFNPRDLLFLYGKKHKVTPFYLNKIDHRFYISKTNSTIPIGSEILSIGNLSVDSLFNLTRLFCPNEAKTVSAKGEIIPKMMRNVFNAQFMTMEQFVNFEYVDFYGDTLIEEAPFIKLKHLYKKDRWFSDKEIEYEFLNRTGYLRVYSFESNNSRAFKKTIDQFFYWVKQDSCDSVVIDVRDNRGGYVLLLEYLLSYINEPGKTYDLNYEYKRSDLDRFETLSPAKKIDFIKKAKRVYPRGMISKEYDFFKSSKGTVSNILYKKTLVNPSLNVFKGACTLFVNGLSMSASVLLASWFKETKRGEVIGTPCFGSVDGTNGNAAIVFLNHSRLPVSISTLKFTPNNITSKEKGDIEIDYKISITLKDIQSGTDPFRDYLFRD